MRTRNFWNLMMILLAGFFFTSCNSTTTTEEADSAVDQAAIEKAFDGLKEDYHSVMAATFHPAEEDNLDPVKAQYAALATSAEVWNKADIPESLQEKGLDKSLKLLAKESKEIGDLIEKGATDEDIKAAIFALHDRFHEIQGQCDDEH